MSKTISRSEAAALSARITEAISGLLAEAGLDAAGAMPRTTYGEVYKFAVTVPMLDLDENGFNLATPEAQAYAFECSYPQWDGARMVTMDADAIGKTFTMNGQTYTFLGTLTKGRKFRYLAQKADGSKVKVTEGAVMRAFGTPVREEVSA